MTDEFTIDPRAYPDPRQAAAAPDTADSVLPAYLSALAAKSGGSKDFAALRVQLAAEGLAAARAPIDEPTAQLLLQAARSGLVSEIALAQADYLCRHYPQQVSAPLVLLVLMLQYKLEQGDVCLRLPVHDDPGSPAAVIAAWRSSSRLRRRWHTQDDFAQAQSFCAGAEVLLEQLAGKKALKLLAHLPFCTAADDEKTDAEPKTPLILSRQRLYFRRYYLYETQAAAFVRRRRELPYYAQDKELLKQALELLFPGAAAQAEPEWQQAAAAAAALNNFTIISGGPGTGKTTTVIRLLLLLTALDPSLNVIALAAPTGKAAARMSESINLQLSSPTSPLPRIAAQLEQLTGREHLLAGIPQTAQTVHRLLKVVPHQVRAHFNAEHPLPADIVVVDEVSMVDLSLFHQLISALSAKTILILLGDKDQLCSVEAGSVLGDLASCLRPGCPQLSDDTAAKLAFLCGRTAAEIRSGILSDNAVLLTRTRRFKGDSGIGRLAATVNTLPPELALAQGQEGQSAQSPQSAALQQEKAAQISRILQECAPKLSYVRAEPSLAGLKNHSRALAQYSVNSGFGPFLSFLAARKFTLTDEEALQAFTLLDKYRVLCSNRLGLLGEQSLNALIAEEVRHKYQLSAQPDFPGRTILITRNDPVQGVTNGDVGFEAYEAGSGHLRIFLPAAQGTVKKVSPLFIPDKQTGFAITVHKSQGSEYQQVLLVLPEEHNPVLTKELIYTAVTRAKDELRIAGVKSAQGFAEDVLVQSCMYLVQRESALSERIYQSKD